MIKKGDKLIIIAEAQEDENNGTIYVKLSSDSQSHMTMLIENCIVAPEPMEIILDERHGYRDTPTIKHIKQGYNQALRDCGVLEDDN